MAIGNKGKVKIEYSGDEPRKLAPFKDDVLYTTEGQRKYPGQITKIPSGSISMAGINYAVKGVDNLGNTQMMYPNQDYHFPGAISVTEYPQLQYGGDSKDLSDYRGINSYGISTKDTIDSPANVYTSNIEQAMNKIRNLQMHPVAIDQFAKNHTANSTTPKTLPAKKQYGGYPSQEKSEEMLHNPPHGKPLTPKQQRYFGMLAHPKHQVGGTTSNHYNTALEGKDPYRALHLAYGTRLDPEDEVKYQFWKADLPKNLQYEGDYDLRGLYSSNPKVKPSANMHFPDTYKLPNHPTFSNESKYYNHSTEDQGGHWNNNTYVPNDPFIKVPVQERYGGPTNINLMKNTFSRAWGGSNPANRNYFSLNTPPSMMAQYGGMPSMGDSTTRSNMRPIVDTVYASPQGRYYLSHAGHNTTQEIDINKYNSYPVHQRGNYEKMVSPNNNIDTNWKTTIPRATTSIGSFAYGGDTHMGNPYLRIPSDHVAGSELNGFNSPNEDPFEDKKSEFLKWLKGTSMDALHKAMIPHATFYHLPDGSIASHAELFPDEDGKQKKGGWIKGAVNPAHNVGDELEVSPQEAISLRAQGYNFDTL